MPIRVPIKVLHEAEGHIVTLETITGEVYRGKLIEAEDNMNLSRRKYCKLGKCLYSRIENKIPHTAEYVAKCADVQEKDWERWNGGVFKSRQCNIMFDFMKHVKSRNYVRELKKNIFLSQAAKIDKKGITVSSKSNNFQGYCELNGKKALTVRKNTEAQEYNDSVVSSIGEKNLNRIWLQHNFKAIILRRYVLMLKLDILNENIQKETCNRRSIISQMPVKLQLTVSTKLTAIKTFEQAIDMLKNYHETVDSSNITMAALHYTTYSKYSTDNDIWSNLRTIFAETPNWIIWCRIFEASQKLSQDIVAVTKFDLLNDKATRHFEFEVLKLRGRFLNLMILNALKKRKAKLLGQNFPSFHEKFVNMFQSQIDPGSIEHANLDDIMSELMLKINSHSFHKGQVLYLEREILLQEAQVVRGCQKEIGHQMLLTATEQIYNEIASLVCQIFLEIESVYHVKEKLSLLRKNVYFMIASILNKLNIPKASENDTGSFEIADILCSTKVDLENSLVNTTLRSETSIKNKANCTAQQVHEVIIFNDLSMDQLREINGCCYFRCHLFNIYGLYSTSTLRLAPGHPSFLYGLVERMKIRLKLNQILHKYGRDEVIKHTVFEESVAAIADSEAIVSELIDEILHFSHETNRKIFALRKFYYFIIGNQLPNFISSDKLFNDRTYADYKCEYIMYHRICCKDVDQ